VSIHKVIYLLFLGLTVKCDGLHYALMFEAYLIKNSYCIQSCCCKVVLCSKLDKIALIRQCLLYTHLSQ